MPAILSPNAKQRFTDNAGAPAASYRLYTYRANTTTPQATFTDRAGAVPNANPIILNARGEATIYLTPGVMYDYVLKTDTDSPVWTQEDVSADAGDADAVAYNDPLAPAYLKTTSDIINGEPVSVLRNIDKTKWAAIRAGSNSDNLYNNFADLLSAMGTQGYGRLDVPRGGYTIGTMLTVPAGVGVHGEGHNATAVKFNAVSNGFKMADNSEVHDLCVDGLSTSLSGILVDTATNTRVSNLRIQNMVFHGYAVSNSTQTQARNLSIVNCQERGVIIDPHSSFNHVTDVYCSGAAKAALLIGHDSHHNIIRGLMAENIGNSALWIHNASYRNQVSQVTIRGTTAPSLTPAILIGWNAYENILSDFLTEGYDVGLLLRGGAADATYATGNTRANLIQNGRIVGVGSGVANSAGVKLDSTDAGVTFCSKNKINNVDITGFQYGYLDPGGNGAFDNVVTGGDLTVDVTTKWSLANAARSRVYNVLGYTPVGPLGGSAPAFPATNIPVTNNNPFPVQIFIKGMPGTGTSTIQINGGDVGATLAPNGGNGTYILQPQQVITPFYGSGTPSWTWFGL